MLAGVVSNRIVYVMVNSVLEVVLSAPRLRSMYVVCRRKDFGLCCVFVLRFLVAGPIIFSRGAYFFRALSIRLFPSPSPSPYPLTHTITGDEILHLGSHYPSDPSSAIIPTEFSPFFGVLFFRQYYFHGPPRLIQRFGRSLLLFRGCLPSSSGVSQRQSCY